MSATTINFKLKQSVTFKPTITITSKAPENLDGWGVWGQWRSSIESSEVVLELKSETGGWVIDIVKRTVTGVVSDETRDAICVAGYSRLVQEIFLISPSGAIFEWVNGNTDVLRSVTRNG